MSARFEVVRTGAGWHARFVAANTKTVWTTEVYNSRHNADKAILSLARAFGYQEPQLTWNAFPVEKMLTGYVASLPWLSVHYLDERVLP